MMRLSIIILVSFGLLVAMAVWRTGLVLAPSFTAPVTESLSPSSSAATQTEPPPVVLETTPLSEVRRTAPFILQAPAQTWDEFYEEMCEEAALLVAYLWYHQDSRTTLPVAEADGLIQQVAAWERDNLGTDVSMPLADWRRVLTEYLGLPSEKWIL